MAEYLEGKRAAFELLTTTTPIKKAYLQKGDKRLDDLIAQLKARNVQLNFVDKKDLDARSSHGAHQGIVLELAPYRYASVKEIIDGIGWSDSALIFVLDHITDEGNFGAILRSAEVVGAAGVIIANKRAAQMSAAVYKTSAGAALHLKIAQVANISQTLQLLKDAGFWVAGASEKAKQNLWQAPLEGKIALVCGNEGAGISPLVQKNCDFFVSLPQKGKIGSLNVAQASTAIAYEWMRRVYQQEGR